MIAKMPTIVAWAYKYSVGQPFVYPRNSLDYASNFLNMCFSVPAEDYVVDPILSPRDGPHLHAARRPRAERLDLDGAARLLLRRQPLRLHRRRRRLPLGPGARRRQRGLPPDAARDRHRRPHPGIHRARQGQGRPVPADGLRPPGLQELRPARQGDEGVGRRGARPARHREQPDAAGRQGARADRARGRLLHREEALSRTSTSIPASSSTRSASRPRCSRRSSRWRAPSAGSRSGRRCSRTRSSRSAGRASSTPARPSRDYVDVEDR